MGTWTKIDTTQPKNTGTTDDLSSNMETMDSWSYIEEMNIRQGVASVIVIISCRLIEDSNFTVEHH